METLSVLFENNKKWAGRMLRDDPDFFKRLAAGQTPRYLWIGCSDSRVPANEIVGLPPGELFVQRNVANLVLHTDLNCLSVLQFAVDALKVRDVIVCGHYGCSGVQAAADNVRLGLIDNWLRSVRDTSERHREVLDRALDPADCLCELNVIDQVRNVANTSVLQDAWARGQEVWIHGWIYSLYDGLLSDLGAVVNSRDAVDRVHHNAVLAAGRRAASRPCTASVNSR